MYRECKQKKILPRTKLYKRVLLINLNYIHSLNRALHTRSPFFIQWLPYQFHFLIQRQQHKEKLLLLPPWIEIFFHPLLTLYSCVEDSNRVKLDHGWFIAIVRCLFFEIMMFFMVLARSTKNSATYKQTFVVAPWPPDGYHLALPRASCHILSKANIPTLNSAIEPCC